MKLMSLYKTGRVLQINTDTNNLGWTIEQNRWTDGISMDIEMGTVGRELSWVKNRSMMELYRAILFITTDVASIVL